MEARSKAFKDEPFHGSKVLMDWLVPDFLQEEVRVSHQLLGYASGVRMLSSPSSLLMRRNEQWRETLRIYPKGQRSFFDAHRGGLSRRVHSCISNCSFPVEKHATSRSQTMASDTPLFRGHLVNGGLAVEHMRNGQRWRGTTSPS